MTKRKHQPTSKSAHESIKPLKSELYRRIEEGLRLLKVGGHFEDIARFSGLKPAQVWKRLSELEKAGIIFNTGSTRPLSSGRKGIVWQLRNLPDTTEPERPVKHKQLPSFSQLSLL